MTLPEAIKVRHSVRSYIDKPIPDLAIKALNDKISECNAEGNLHVQLVLDEPKAFSGIMAYGMFSGVRNYLVMAGRKAKDLDERVGYYGEQLVLLAQTLGLNTCWAGLTYNKISGTYSLEEDEKICCYISLGYGKTQGHGHHIKTIDEVSNVGRWTPEWFLSGVEAALLAPTAVNQQKFYIKYLGQDKTGKATVSIDKGFSLVGYTKMDMGIAKLHFELGSGKENFEWKL